MAESVQPLLTEAENALRTAGQMVAQKGQPQTIMALSQYADALTSLAFAKHRLAPAFAKEDQAAERVVQSALDAEPVTEP